MAHTRSCRSQSSIGAHQRRPQLVALARRRYARPAGAAAQHHVALLQQPMRDHRARHVVGGLRLRRRARVSSSSSRKITNTIEVAPRQPRRRSRPSARR